MRSRHRLWESSLHASNDKCPGGEGNADFSGAAIGARARSGPTQLVPLHLAARHGGRIVAALWSER